MFNIMQAIGNVVQVAKTITNPKQAINMALGVLQKQGTSGNNAAQMVKNEINKGTNCEDIIKEQAKNGVISKKTLRLLKKLYNAARTYGFVKIPEGEWQKVENAIDSGEKLANIDNNSNGFNGF